MCCPVDQVKRKKEGKEKNVVARKLPRVSFREIAVGASAWQTLALPLVFFLQMAAVEAAVAANIVDLITISYIAHDFKAYFRVF